MVSVVSLQAKTGILVEDGPGEATAAELTAAALGVRVRQQEILAELGVLALRGTPFTDLLSHTARLAAEGLDAEFGQVLEFMPADQRFLLRAGVGWLPGVVGTATVGAGLASPAGCALQTGLALISNHLAHEQRFRTPELLLRHGIRRAISVILQGDNAPFGVLEVDSTSEGEFNDIDIVFLQGAANILGMAIERHRIEPQLRDKIGRHQVLLNEVNHRIGNSLQIVSAVLQLQAMRNENPDVTHGLQAASGRIAAVARAHQRLYAGGTTESLDLGCYLTAVCDDLRDALPGRDIAVDAASGIHIATDNAFHVALLVNELITNAAKYAYPSGHCRVWVGVARGPGDIAVVSVRDEGIGLPADFDIKSGERLGMRLINAFTAQLKATLEIKRHAPGTEFILSVPAVAPVSAVM